MLKNDQGKETRNFNSFDCYIATFLCVAWQHVMTPCCSVSVRNRSQMTSKWDTQGRAKCITAAASVLLLFLLHFEVFVFLLSERK